jgi:hypothetical protein
MSRSTHAEPNTTTFRVRPSAIFVFFCAREADEDGSSDGMPRSSRDLGTGSDRAYRVEREREARAFEPEGLERRGCSRGAHAVRVGRTDAFALRTVRSGESVAVSWLSREREPFAPANT